jgi:hypothetical protein
MRTGHVRVHQPETYRVSATPQPEGPGKRHRFISRAEHIRRRDGVSRAESLTRGRQEFPETYTDYQDHLSRRSTSRQHMVRGWNKVGKAAPSFESLVNEQLAKGCPNYEVAAQRVLTLHGADAWRNRSGINKAAADLTERFQKRVDALIDEGYSGTEACQIVRQQDNGLMYKVLQII